MSVLWSYAYFFIISGLKYIGVSTYFDFKYLSLLTIVLSLKSPNLTVLSFVIRTLSGFTSLWMMSCEWQWSKAKIIWKATYQISLSEKYFLLSFYLFIRVCISPYSANSITIYKLLGFFYISTFSGYWLN